MPNEPFQGTVAADGTLTVSFGPQFNNKWRVGQVTLEMPNAPAGATAEVRYMASLISPSPSAKRASAGGEPSILLHGGETMSVVWEGCTPGDIGSVLVTYTKESY